MVINICLPEPTVSICVGFHGFNEHYIMGMFDVMWTEIAMPEAQMLITILVVLNCIIV